MKKLNLLMVIVVGFLSTFLFLKFQSDVTIALSNHPPHIKTQLYAAEKNKRELLKVLKFFSKRRSDSQKLQAAYFLINNMEGLSGSIYSLKNKRGLEIKLNLRDYNNRKDILKVIDSLDAKIHLIQIPDLKIISSNYLIDHIERSFNIWRRYEWCKNITFEDFCEYLLPYRVGNEKLNNWMVQARQRYKWLSDSMKYKTGISLATAYINDELKNWFAFGSKHYIPNNALTLDDMVESEKGNCEAMTNLAIFTMRSVGIPVMKDFTPFWANMHNGHVWNSIYNEDGDLLPFLGAEANPPYPPFANGQRVAAKIFRNTFSKQLSAPIPDININNGLNPFIHDRVRDVTHEYMSVADIELVIQQTNTSKPYICVFNGGEWRPIFYGHRDQNKIRFANMGKGVLYLAAYSKNNQVVPFGPPFVVYQSGQLKRLTMDSKEDLHLTRVMSKDHAIMELYTLPLSKDKMQAEAKLIYAQNGKRLSIGKEYSLFYWENRWIRFDTEIAAKDGIHFKSVPSNVLYLLLASDITNVGKARPFTWEHGKQVFW